MGKENAQLLQRADVLLQQIACRSEETVVVTSDQFIRLGIKVSKTQKERDDNLMSINSGLANAKLEDTKTQLASEWYMSEEVVHAPMHLSLCSQE